MILKAIFLLSNFNDLGFSKNMKFRWMHKKEKKVHKYNQSVRLIYCQ